jgi:cbb3-type cytochrome oxidase subunit 3
MKWKHVKRILLWMLVVLFLVAVLGVYHAYAPKRRFNVAPDAEREIEKAMHR